MNTPTDGHSPVRARRQPRRLRHLLSLRKLLIISAALSLFQATGCYPDPLGALNFELQRLLSGTLVNALNIIVRNLLDL